MEVKENKLFRNKLVDKQYRLVQVAYLENTFELIYNVHATKIHCGN